MQMGDAMLATTRRASSGHASPTTPSSTLWSAARSTSAAAGMTRRGAFASQGHTA
jgi:hypothetical protein